LIGPPAISAVRLPRWPARNSFAGQDRSRL
jgi:hypothetical protein